jgi:hypothetical protein
MDADLKINPQYIFVGLGDYMDKGKYSLRVLTILLLIALKNPQNAILIRGNHEDLLMNDNIRGEMVQEFGIDSNTNEILNTLARIYDIMPSVLYTTQICNTSPIHDYLIFSHGLLSFKFNPSEFLKFDNTKLNEDAGSRMCIIKENITPDELIMLFKDSTAIFDMQIKCEDIRYGFWWNDLGIENTETVQIGEAYRLQYKSSFVANFCKKYCSNSSIISGMVGGHQHDFAKIIAANLGIDRNEISSAVGYTLINHEKTYQTQMGLIEKTDISFPNCFSFVKFVSSPGIFAYRPTYLIVSKNENAPWSYRAVEPMLFNYF